MSWRFIVGVSFAMSVVVGGVWPALAQNQAGPGFNCAAAKRADTKAICADPELSKLDRELNRVYGLAESAQGPAAMADLRSKSLARRGRCGSDAGCIKTWYLDMTSQYMAKIPESGSATSAATSPPKTPSATYAQTQRPGVKSLNLLCKKRLHADWNEKGYYSGSYKYYVSIDLNGGHLWWKAQDLFYNITISNEKFIVAALEEPNENYSNNHDELRFDRFGGLLTRQTVYYSKSTGTRQTRGDRDVFDCDVTEDQVERRRRF